MNVRILLLALAVAAPAMAQPVATTAAAAASWTQAGGSLAGFEGGEDVALYADGPGSALVCSTIAQNSIVHNIAHALGWR